MRRYLGSCLLLLSLVLTSCSSRATGHRLTWRTLSRGLTSGLTEAQNTVIRDEATYLRLWAQHAADIDRPAFPPQVDFSREMVIVVGLGNRPTGGFLVEVVDAELRGRTLRILVGEREPLPGSLQIQRLTQPYQIIALPAVSARVQFRSVRESSSRSTTRRARPGESGPRTERSMARIPAA